MILRIDDVIASKPNKKGKMNSMEFKKGQDYLSGLE